MNEGTRDRRRLLRLRRQYGSPGAAYGPLVDCPVSGHMLFFPKLVPSPWPRAKPFVVDALPVPDPWAPFMGQAYDATTGPFKWRWRDGEPPLCRVMETRTCPASYRGRACGDVCARFESDDETPWRLEAMTSQAPAQVVERPHWYNRQLQPISPKQADKLLGDRNSRRVALDRITSATDPKVEYVISTVFLALDHAYTGTPILFETMVFGGSDDQDQTLWRYHTEAEAVAGHAEVVASVAATVPDDVVAEIPPGEWS